MVGRHWSPSERRLRSPQGRPPTHTTYETIEELVENAISVHLRAAERLAQIEPSRLSSRGQMLLQHMIRYEQDMELLLREFIAKASDNVLETYLQYTQELHPEELLNNAIPQVSDGITDEELGRTAQALHQYFVELFETAVREAGSEDTEQFLADLLQLERARQRQFTRVISSMFDM